MLPLTDEHFYFKQSGPYRGQVTGFCKPCHNAYCRVYGRMLTGAKLAKRRLQQRDWQRRTEGYDPNHFRTSVYEAILAAADLPPVPLRAEAPLEQQAAS